MDVAIKAICKENPLYDILSTNDSFPTHSNESNIISPIEIYETTSKKYKYIIEPYAHHGNLNSFIDACMIPSELACIQYFKQICNGVKSL